MANGRTKWVCIYKAHLGTIKSEVRIGSIVEHDPENYWMFVDGRKYENDFDFRLLQKKGWILPYTEENLKKARNMADGLKKTSLDAEIEQMKRLKMEVVSGDEDIVKVLDREEDKKAPVKNVPVEAQPAKMEVVRGEDITDADLNPPVSKAQANPVKMEVVRGEDITDAELNPAEPEEKAKPIIIRNESDVRTIDATPRRGRQKGRNYASEAKPMEVSNGDESVGRVIGRIDQFIDTSSENPIKATTRPAGD